tara:strand:+ start:888 stop:1193 length:306 start_codon:yes stop_codon:yes gene_type:complete
MRFLAIAVCLVALSACATPDWDDATPARCRVPTASVTLGCTVRWNGSLSECTVLDESAPNCGFAKLALEGAARTRSSPSDNWQAGERVQFTTQFTNAPAPH